MTRLDCSLSVLFQRRRHSAHEPARNENSNADILDRGSRWRALNLSFCYNKHTVRFLSFLIDKFTTCELQSSEVASDNPDSFVVKALMKKNFSIKIGV
jgi:transposase InsO family protein